MNDKCETFKLASRPDLHGWRCVMCYHGLVDRRSVVPGAWNHHYNFCRLMCCMQGNCHTSSPIFFCVDCGVWCVIVKVFTKIPKMILLPTLPYCAFLPLNRPTHHTVTKPISYYHNQQVTDKLDDLPDTQRNPRQDRSSCLVLLDLYSIHLL